MCYGLKRPALHGISSTKVFSLPYREVVAQQTDSDCVAPWVALFVGTVLKTLAGNEITVSGGMVGGSKIKKSDIKAGDYTRTLSSSTLALCMG